VTSPLSEECKKLIAKMEKLTLLGEYWDTEEVVGKRKRGDEEFTDLPGKRLRLELPICTPCPIRTSVPAWRQRKGKEKLVEKVKSRLQRSVSRERASDQFRHWGSQAVEAAQWQPQPEVKMETVTCQLQSEGPQAKVKSEPQQEEHQALKGVRKQLYPEERGRTVRCGPQFGELRVRVMSHPPSEGSQAVDVVQRQPLPKVKVEKVTRQLQPEAPPARVNPEPQHRKPQALEGYKKQHQREEHADKVKGKTRLREPPTKMMSLSQSEVGLIEESRQRGGCTSRCVTYRDTDERNAAILHAYNERFRKSLYEQSDRFNPPRTRIPTQQRPASPSDQSATTSSPAVTRGATLGPQSNVNHSPDMTEVRCNSLTNKVTRSLLRR
jgi:hypothetical protein